MKYPLIHFLAFFSTSSLRAAQLERFLVESEKMKSQWVDLKDRK